ncbi:PREDICTED: pathogenesis-related protein 5-like [Nelumbo nucifera]|uniref:Pathogenesis-related protein 5-like n=2 Tax=Nelumbo nucifera TaxID=4432 RepID=A0A822ZY16_NELNU|nr:PREDICTED: pathogenesis-related protein 5-like [Nelumbo nucifera]DAD46808.1 TPA_asm: hypothetical protein HUJ06_016745 [Nelumbo nucifera]
MDFLLSCYSSLTLSFFLLIIFTGVSGTILTVVNNCDYTVWPGIYNAGGPILDSRGFELTQGSSRSFQAPTGWNGRFWGRTGCNFNASGQGSCATGGCRSGQIECNDMDLATPVTMAEFSLGLTNGQDSYDISLVDGFNLSMRIEGRGGQGTCLFPECVND